MIRRTAIAVVAGLSGAALYTISPLTICVLACGAAILPLAYRGLLHRERRWLTAILVTATFVRVVAIGGMLVRNTPYHDDQLAGEQVRLLRRLRRVRQEQLHQHRVGAAGDFRPDAVLAAAPEHAPVHGGCVAAVPALPRRVRTAARLHRPRAGAVLADAVRLVDLSAQRAALFFRRESRADLSGPGRASISLAIASDQDRHRRRRRLPDQGPPAVGAGPRRHGDRSGLLRACAAGIDAEARGRGGRGGRRSGCRRFRTRRRASTRRRPRCGGEDPQRTRLHRRPFLQTAGRRILRQSDDT